MKIKLLIISLLCFTIGTEAQSFISKLEFGIEWGYSQNVYNNFRHTILSPTEGYRFKESGSRFFLYPHLRFNLRCSYHINDYMSASIIAGSTGIGKDTNLYPLMLRFSFFSKSMSEDSLFTIVEAGYGIRKPNGNLGEEALLVDLGEGYRFILSSRYSFDIVLLLNYAYNKPQIPNPDGPGFLSGTYILSNNSDNIALSLILAFNF